MKTTYYEVTPEFIKKLRNDMRIPSDKFSMLLGVSQNTIYNWEVGVSKPSTLHKAALIKMKTKYERYTQLGDKKREEFTKTIVTLLVAAGVIAAISYLFTDD